MMTCGFPTQFLSDIRSLKYCFRMLFSVTLYSDSIAHYSRETNTFPYFHDVLIKPVREILEKCAEKKKDELITRISSSSMLQNVIRCQSKS